MTLPSGEIPIPPDQIPLPQDDVPIPDENPMPAENNPIPPELQLPPPLHLNCSPPLFHPCPFIIIKHQLRTWKEKINK